MNSMMKKSITIIAGCNRDGNKETFGELTLNRGETISIVGPTGSGKTALITDIELLAYDDSVTKRRVLVDGERPSDEMRFSPLCKPVAMLSQNTKCFSDMYVEDFISIHARARGITSVDILDKVLDMSNRFTGEKITKKVRVTELSGGQTRSLLVADAILIGASPIILLDEIENAGIDKNEIVKIMKQIDDKLIIFVTHDPLIALQTEKRIVMANGSVQKIIERTNYEKELVKELVNVNLKISELRELVRKDRVVRENNLFAHGF